MAQGDDKDVDDNGVVHRLLIVVASLIVEHGLQGIRASGVVAPGL